MGERQEFLEVGCARAHQVECETRPIARMGSNVPAWKPQP